MEVKVLRRTLFDLQFESVQLAEKLGKDAMGPQLRAVPNDQRSLEDPAGNIPGSA
jgi:hypothetical protein